MNEENTFVPPSTGAIKSPPDYRDIPLAAVIPIPASMPDAFFNDVSKLPQWNQLALGACVGHAGGKYCQKLEQCESNKVVPFSPRFLYAIAKATDGMPDTQGTFPRAVAQAWQTYGCATENTVPNDTYLSHDEYTYHHNIANIPKAAFDEAKQYAIKSYAFPGTTAEGLQNAIINTKGCMLMMQVGAEWWTRKDGHYSQQASDILPLRAPNPATGSHELWLYGYDHVNGRLRFWIFNSWGRDWGMNGVGYFFYDEYHQYINESLTAVDLPDDWLQHVHDLPPAPAFKHFFNQPIKYGDKGEEVKALQQALYIDGVLKVDPSIFGNYLSLTAEAVKAFQAKYKLASPADIAAIGGKSCGPVTRAKLNELFNK